MIDFIKEQRQRFEYIIQQVKENPQEHLGFNSVADVYQAKWIQNLPPMCRWYVSGLDDGAEDYFYISVYFQDECIIFEPYLTDI